MSQEFPLLDDERIQSAVAEFQAMISERFPEATYEVYQGDDPVGVYLIAKVDTDDTDEAMDLVIERLVTLRIDEEVPIHVVPVPTWERVEAMLANAPRWRIQDHPLPLAVG